MPTIVLIKHAKPEVRPEEPSHDWPLSGEGRAQAAVLADRLRSFGLTSILSSEEPKAAETGQIIAAALGLTAETAPDLHEHDRTNVPHMPTREFLSFMALFFKRESERVLGRESAREARDRITRAIDEVAEAHDGPIGIVSHGTVIALYAGPNAGMDPYQLWRRMQLPSYLVIDTKTRTVRELVERVG